MQTEEKEYTSSNIVRRDVKQYTKCNLQPRKHMYHPKLLFSSDYPRFNKYNFNAKGLCFVPHRFRYLFKGKFGTLQLCNNSILTENIASIKAIIFVTGYLQSNLTYLITTETTTESLQRKVDLCKCNHFEFFHIDEEGHGVCRSCTCEEYDPQ
jgi:hypothetical protein